MTASFLSYGGHSLGAAMVVSRIQKDLGLTVPLSSMLVATTVRSLAAEIMAGVNPSGFFIPLRHTTHSAAPWLVVLPGLGEGPFRFAHLATRIDIEAYGFRMPGTEPGEEPLDSIEGIAKCVIEQIGQRDVSSLAVAGYSFGGVVAFEVCRQLTALGKPPLHLFLLDVLAPGYPRKHPLSERIRLHARTLRALGHAERRAILE